LARLPFLPSRLQPPDDAKQHQHMPPMIDVDLERLKKEGEQHREEDLRLTLEWRRPEHEPKADKDGDAHDEDE